MNTCGGSQRRSTAPSAMTNHAGTSPSHTHCDSHTSAGQLPASQTTPATAVSVSTANGKPSISVSKLAPDNCTDTPPARTELGSICGNIQNQGTNTTPARKGLSKGPASMRQGRNHAAKPSVSKASAASNSVSIGQRVWKSQATQTMTSINPCQGIWACPCPSCRPCVSSSS